MDDRFECPHCGKELTAIAVELHRLSKNHESLELKLSEIISTIFDDEELGKLSDRAEDNE